MDSAAKAPVWSWLVLGVLVAACHSSVENPTSAVTPSTETPVAAYDTVPTGAVTVPCVVESVTDGDTFRCVGGRRVRLLTIDAPEMTQTPFGATSRQRLAELLPLQSTVTLELDVEVQDVYGRTLAYVRRGGVFVNRALVRGGMAVVAVYPPNVRYVVALRAAADSARIETAGLWATSGFECLPADHRRNAC